MVVFVMVVRSEVVVCGMSVGWSVSVVMVVISIIMGGERGVGCPGGINLVVLCLVVVADRGGVAAVYNDKLLTVQIID